MSQQVNDVKTFTASEDLAVYRRVKMSSGSVVYADASDDAIGITQDAVSSGDPVPVKLLNSGSTFKLTCGEAVDLGDTVIGGADGKVIDTIPTAPASGQRFYALEAGSGDDSVIECVCINTVSKYPEMQLITKLGITDANAADVTIETLTYEFQICDWWIVSRDTTAANITLKNDGNAVSAVVAKGTANDAIVRAADLIAAQDTVAADTALTVGASAVAPFDIYILGYRTA